MYNNPKVTDKDGNVIDPLKEALEKYSRNLTQLARDNKLMPAIGRTAEINAVIQILARRRKNNPILTGPPGSGKTTIVEALAKRIVDGDVPEQFKNKQILELSLTSLMAGAKYVGDFEQNLKNVMDAVKADGNIILFVDESHLLLGAGATGEGSMDAANILKPALARGELRMIGATTLKEYRKYFEKDPALSRRFGVVSCNEPTVDDTINILRGLKSRYEAHHGVTIRDSALISAAHLSNRYITSKYQPDKSLDLLDEACSALRVQLDSKPQVIEKLERSILQKRVEQTALKQELNRLHQTKQNIDKALANNNNNSGMPQDQRQKLTLQIEQINSAVEQIEKRLKQIELDVANLQESLVPLEQRYQQQYGKNKELQAAKQKLDDIKTKIEIAERAKDYGKVADLRYGALIDIEQRIKKLELEIKEQAKQTANDPNANKDALLTEVVGPEQIAEVCSRFTGIPLGKLTQSEATRYLNLEHELSQRVIGQNVAVRAVANAIMRNKAGLTKPGQPIASFFLCGPTGVGKSELAKALSSVLFNTEKAMVRFDMSEFSEKHSVQKLIGAPPGYVGSDRAGLLTEAVRTQPYRVVLFDEAEKAHKSIWTTLLQILDDGRITDNQGRVVDFSNTVILFTSNLGAQWLANINNTKKGINVKAEVAKVKPKILEAVKQYFAPEFLNRLTELIMFEPLQNKDMYNIIKLQMNEISQRMIEQDIRVEFADEDAMEEFINATYDSTYGARSLKRTLERTVVTHLAKEVLKGHLKPHSNVKVRLNSQSTQIAAQRGVGWSTSRQQTPIATPTQLKSNVNSTDGLLYYTYIPLKPEEWNYGVYGATIPASSSTSSARKQNAKHKYRPDMSDEKDGSDIDSDYYDANDDGLMVD